MSRTRHPRKPKRFSIAFATWKWRRWTKRFLKRQDVDRACVVRATEKTQVV